MKSFMLYAYELTTGYIRVALKIRRDPCSLDGSPPAANNLDNPMNTAYFFCYLWFVNSHVMLLHLHQKISK